MKLKSINPATEKSIGEFELYTKTMVDDAVKKAQRAFYVWKNIDILRREKIIQKFSRLLEGNKKEFARLVSKEMGKPVTESGGEIDGALGIMNWFLKETKNAIKSENIKVDDKKVTAGVKFEPVGVVGIITPWNFPIDSSLWKIVPALLTGNTVVYKPSELSTLCGLKIGELLRKSGLPNGVFNIITGDGRTGRYLVSSGVNKISFTGSSKAGKDVAINAGKALKKTVLELGGSDPFIIFEDADLEQAVNAALFGRFLNC